MGQHWMQRAQQRQGGRARVLCDDLRVIGRMDAALAAPDARAPRPDWRSIGDLLRVGAGSLPSDRPAPEGRPYISPENSGCP